MYQVRFGDQGLDLWAHTVQPPGSQSRLEIEGREETVHSNVQILWGQIARAERNLSRDVYDLVQAAKHDPASLEIAVNAHPRGVAEWAARSWNEGSAEIAFDAGTRLRGIPTAERTQLDTLGERGERTIKAALYEELTLRTAGDRLQIESRTAGEVNRRAEIGRPHPRGADRTRPDGGPKTTRAEHGGADRTRRGTVPQEGRRGPDLPRGCSARNPLADGDRGPQPARRAAGQSPGSESLELGCRRLEFRSRTAGSVLLAAQSVGCYGGGNDRDAVDASERQHVLLVTGDDQVRSSCDRGGQDRVVVGVR